MTWFGWVLIAFMAWSCLMSVNSVGKPRSTPTPGVAVVAVILAALIVTGILTVGTGSL